MSTAPKAPLHLAWCNAQAARYACENWHYSGSMPMPPNVHIGVWEFGEYIGCVIFSRGANLNLAKAFRLKTTECCELTRIALRAHKAPVSRIVAIAIRMLCAKEPTLQLAVSYADPLQSHVGGVYQAGNWIYTGRSADSWYYVDAQGRRLHTRQVSTSGIQKQYGKTTRVPRAEQCSKHKAPGKHRYIYPLNADARARFAGLAKPYPKRAVVSG